MLARLVLRHFLRVDDRGLVTLVAEWGEVRRALQLAHVPHYSTLCYAARRLDAATFGALRAACFRRAGAAGLTAPGTLLDDAGDDAEHNHRLCRALGIRASVISRNPRNAGRRRPLTPARRALRRQFPRELYRLRWHAESVFSRHGRRPGSARTARRPRTQRRETPLRVPTHNLMILRRTS